MQLSLPATIIQYFLGKIYYKALSEQKKKIKILTSLWKETTYVKIRGSVIFVSKS
jgi:uncharacterized pyridoxamine 5'-phosphate oxidase family protein